MSYSFHFWPKWCLSLSSTDSPATKHSTYKPHSCCHSTAVFFPQTRSIPHIFKYSGGATNSFLFLWNTLFHSPLK